MNWPSNLRRRLVGNLWAADEIITATKLNTTGASMTTAQRDLLSPSEGDLIYNTTLGLYQYYNGSDWVSLVEANVNTVLSSQSTLSSKVGSNLEATFDGEELIDFGSISANSTSSIRAIFVEGAEKGGTVEMGLPPDLESGLVLAWYSCTKDNAIEFSLGNITGSPIVPKPNIYKAIVRNWIR